MENKSTKTSRFYWRMEEVTKYATIEAFSLYHKATFSIPGVF